MSYDVNNIILLNLILTPSGLGYANFSTGLIFANLDDGVEDPYFTADSYRDYNSLTELAEDFDTTSETYLIASRWFASIPRPPSITVWMMDEYDTPAEAVAKANAEIWRFWWFFSNNDLSEVNATALAALADSTEHGLPITISDAEAIDPADDTDLGSVLQALGNRFVFVGYKSPASIAIDPSQAYVMVQLAATFHKFRPEGLRTAITAEYQVLSGISGDDLTTTAYEALTSKNIVFFAQVELQGSVDSSRVINSKSMSSYGEYMDDVINLAVLKNRLQVSGYNYITGAGTKRPLTPRGYSGLLKVLGDTCKQFYDNGVLGESNYTDILDGETKLAKFGYVVYSKPEDVFDLTTTERANRVFPETSITVILARAGHTASITVKAE